LSNLTGAEGLRVRQFPEHFPLCSGIKDVSKCYLV